MRRFILLAVFAAMPLLGQTEDRVLLPVAIRQQVPGAFGSLWETRITVLNNANDPLIVDGLQPSCRISGCPPFILQPHATASAAVTAAGTPGLFLRVADARAITAHLRIQDVARQSQTWGTEIPVIKEMDALTTPTELIDVPLATEFRSLLRVYDFNPAAHGVRVQVFEISDATEPTKADELIDERVLSLVPTGDARYFPGYAELMLPTTPSDQRRVRVQITPVDSGLRYWAFVSVTNNATQHVTVITPQR